jgi:hypothetical protein
VNRNGSLRRLYAELEPNDQARLVIEALARDDRSEADRIAAAVPRCAWWAPVGSFEAVLTEAREVSSAAILAAATVGRSFAIADTLLEIGRFQAGRLADVASFEVYKAATQDETADVQLDGMLEQAHQAAAEESESLLSTVEEWRTEALGELAAFWRAFDAYCRERIGMNPETVEDAFLPPGLRRPEAIKGVEPNPDDVAAATAALSKLALPVDWSSASQRGSFAGRLSSILLDGSTSCLVESHRHRSISSRSGGERPMRQEPPVGSRPSQTAGRDGRDTEANPSDHSVRRLCRKVRCGQTWLDFRPVTRLPCRD